MGYEQAEVPLQFYGRGDIRNKPILYVTCL